MHSPEQANLLSGHVIPDVVCDVVGVVDVTVLAEKNQT